jgi:hypothetical protein
MRRWYRAPILLALLVTLAGPALAQTTAKPAGAASGIQYSGWGVRVGGSSNPDQIYGGFHWDLGEFARNVRFRPLVEFGTGDHKTLVQGMAEVTYIFSKIQVWKPYVGGDIGFTYTDTSRSVLPPGADRTDTDMALMGVGGIETKLRSGVRFFLEGKVGFGSDDPDFKLGAGWTWK